MEISGKTKVYAIIGDPIAHTLSPSMHNAAFSNLKLDFVYVAFRVKKEELGKTMRCIRSIGLQGLNVTMPHKNTVIKYLDEMEPTAQSIGAVNTVLNHAGKLIGFNTDGVGATRALKENGVDLFDKKLLIIGAGGAAKAIAFQAMKEGVESLVILNRTADKAKRLAKILSRRFSKKIDASSLSTNSIEKELKGSDILINATSVGMPPKLHESPIAPVLLRPDLCVMDIIYNPAETMLVKSAKAIGAKVVSGIEMLVYQGAASFEIWTSRPAPIQVMKNTAQRMLSGAGVSN